MNCLRRILFYLAFRMGNFGAYCFAFIVIIVITTTTIMCSRIHKFRVAHSAH